MENTIVFILMGVRLIVNEGLIHYMVNNRNGK